MISEGERALRLGRLLQTAEREREVTLDWVGGPSAVARQASSFPLNPMLTSSRDREEIEVEREEVRDKDIQRKWNVEIV